MKAVSNASPLLFLSKIGALDLLPSCFAQLYVPDAVIAELRELHLPPVFIRKTLSPQGMGFVQDALGKLHQGELEDIRLAVEISADYVLLDDLAARRKAAHFGLRVMGTAGTLLLARQSGLLSADVALEYLDTLVEKHNLYLSLAVRTEFEAALREAE